IKKPKEVIKEEAISTISRLVKPKVEKEKEIETIQQIQLEYPMQTVEQQVTQQTQIEEMYRVDQELVGRTPFEHAPQLQQPAVSKIKKPKTKELIREEAVSTISQ